MRWIDIGVNLFSRSFPDPAETLRAAREAGVYCILTGSDGAENAAIEAFLRDHDALGTAGIHPHHAAEAREEDFAAIRRLAGGGAPFVAVGECGLDYDRMFSPREAQLSCLSRQLDIAEETGMPLFLHEREALSDFTSLFAPRPSLCKRAVVHCFTEGPDALETLLAMGFMVGITGWICDERRGGALREAARVLPRDRFMLETDAPYLTPRGVPGLARTNVPGNIRYVSEKLAACMGVAPEEAEAAALSNTLRFFGLRMEDGTVRARA